MQKVWLWSGTLGVLLLDQLSKRWALHALPQVGTVPWMPGVQAVLSFNKGMAFGLFSHANYFQILSIVLALAVVVMGALAIHRHWVVSLGERISVALLMAGALGNAMDRMFYGFVVDFIDVYVGSWHWYTFYVADIALCLGAMGWMWSARRATIAS